MMKRLRCGSFRVLDLFAAIWNVLLKGIERRFNEILFAFSVFLFIEFRPVAPIGVGAAYDSKAFFASRSSSRIIETEGSRSDFSIEQQVGSKQGSGRAEQQIAGRFGNRDTWLESHVDLSATVIQSYRLSIREELWIEVFWPNHIENGRSQIRVADYGSAFDFATTHLINESAEEIVLFG